MAVAVWWFHRTGATLLSGDAEAHLNIARRIVDSRTPGWNQVGTTWLPLPHLLMIPFIRYDGLWTSGLAAAIPAAICMCLAAAFLFATVRRVLESDLAGWSAAAVFVLNPNSLYLGSVPMTEAALFATLFALLYCTVRYADSGAWGWTLGAGIAGTAATWVRYEGWFLIPFVALYLLVSRRRAGPVVLFCVIVAIGPALWLFHNRFYFGDPFYFYRGPWSAKAIQANKPYPGKGNWAEALQYYLAAGKLLAKPPALWLAAGGSILALRHKAARWPVLFFLLPCVFYVWSMHGSGTPIFVPQLPPHGHYNIRYGMALIPLAALGAAAVAQFGRAAAALAVALALIPHAIDIKTHAIAWQEAERNSEGRRQWTAQVVAYLKANAKPNETYFTSFGDMTAIYRTLGISLKRTLTGDNGPEFDAACARPDLALRADWAVVMGGDTVQGVLDQARLKGPFYELERRIFVKGQPVIEIYRRKEPLPSL